MSDTYTADFYDALELGTIQSAETVVPLVLTLIGSEIGTVLDVGCGRAVWAAQFERHGKSVTAVDGPHVDTQRLHVPADRFSPVDLNEPGALSDRFDSDLVICLEVAEHLAPGRSDTFIDELVDAGAWILFSAAIPGQPAAGHCNCQWQSAWADRFKERGRPVSSLIRDGIWDDDRVDVWYRQNMLLVGPPDAKTSHPALFTSIAPLDVIHPEMWAWFAPVGHELR